MLLEKILQSTHETLNELASLIRQRVFLSALCGRITRCQVLTTVHFGATDVCPEEVVLGDELVVEVFED